MGDQALLGTVVLSLTAFSAGTGFVLAAYALGRRSTAANYYALVAALAASWSLAYLVQLAAPSPALIDTVYPFVVIFATLSPFAWLAFTLVWTDRTHWLTHPLALVLFAEPLAFIALFLAGGAPGLIDPSTPTTTYAGLMLVEVTSPPGETFQVLFSYAIITAATVLLGHSFFETRQIYRRQTGLLLAGSTIVFASSVTWYLGLTPHPALDLTPVLSVGNALVAGYAIFGYGALRQLPVTATSIIDALDDPVIVVDRDGDITNLNDAATALLLDSDVGTSLEDALPGLAEAARTGATYSVPAGGSRETYDVSQTPATNSTGETLAYTYHLRNVTHRVHRAPQRHPPGPPRGDPLRPPHRQPPLHHRRDPRGGRRHRP